MADTESPQLSSSSDTGRRRGGWISCFFIAGGMTGFKLAGGGIMSNLIVYLIREFNVKNIEAAQITNIVSSCTLLAPVFGAIIADSLLGCFSVIVISSIISLLGTILLLLTATLSSLKPQPCEFGSNQCKTPSEIQFATLYAGIGLGAIGAGGLHSTIAAFGADQFDSVNDRGSFFNCYFFILYMSLVLSGTAIVYVEDKVSWAWGFGICVAANVIGLAIFLWGHRYYRHVKPQGSPFTSLARVIVASIRKGKVLMISSNSEGDYYHGHDKAAKLLPSTPSRQFSFFNRAALKTEGDIKYDGSIAKPWRLCTVQQVEDLKTLARIFPLWSTGVFLYTPIAVQVSLIVLQVLTMDRHLGPHFEIPAGSFPVLLSITVSISLPVVDKIVCPVWQKLTHLYPTTLQRVGVGHVLNLAGVAVSALVESKRLSIAHSFHLQDKPAGSTIPMSAWWLLPQMALVGFGEAFLIPGQVELYYREFPTSLRSTATAMNALNVGIAFYLSSALMDIVQRNTSWLPDDINNGRLDNLYWTLAVIGLLNFGYYLVCSKLYRSRNFEHKGMAIQQQRDDNSCSDM